MDKIGVDINNIKNLSIDKVKKLNLSEPKKKLGTNLLRLIDNSFLLPNQSRTQIVSQMKGLKQFVAKADSVKIIDKRVANKTHNDLVYVYVNFKSISPTSVIDSIVWKVTDRDEKNHLAVALVEIDKLEALASLSGVRSISSVLPPVTNSGSVVTEGDIIHQTASVRSAYSQGGSGIKIGVISDGVDNIASSQSTGDLPAGVTVLSNSIGGDEGTAMLEIIYDMVPNASLYFHDAGSNIIAFNSAIDVLVAAGANVIVDDIAWIAQPYFEDGEIASHVASVLAANNIVYVSSAGNYAKEHYQGNYSNDGINFHDFSSGSQPTFKYLYVDIPSGESVDVFLQWNDSFGSSANDYDLKLFNKDDWSILDQSIYEQNGDDNPLEIVSYTNTTGGTIKAEIDISNYQGLAAAKNLEIFILGDNLIHYTDNRTAADSIFGHAAVPGVIAVGAIAANDPGNDTIESFSSQGPVTIIGQAQRAKPDIAGIDKVKVTGAGGFGDWNGTNYIFGGTSAAAPHIAAIAAQLWGQYPSVTGNQIKNHILNSAVDLGATGFDTIFGYGRANALFASNSLSEKKPPYAVAIDNYKDDVPVSGVNEADVVYEFPVEGGITRFMAIYNPDNTNTSVEIGPVRSARPYFARTASEHNAIYAHAGGSPAALQGIADNEYNIYNLDALTSENDSYFWRDTNKNAPYNLYTSIEKLNNFRQNVHLTGGSFTSPWIFSDSPSSLSGVGFSQGVVIVNNENVNYNVKWIYDETAGVYYRQTYNNGNYENYIDSNNNQVSTVNLAIQYATTDPSTEISQTTGEALLCREGKCAFATWQKADLNSNVKFYLKDSGVEFQFKTGKLWINVTAPSTIATVTSGTYTVDSTANYTSPHSLDSKLAIKCD